MLARHSLPHHARRCLKNPNAFKGPWCQSYRQVCDQSFADCESNHSRLPLLTWTLLFGIYSRNIAPMLSLQVTMSPGFGAERVQM